MKIIALYNIKGGVGKTATSVNLAYLAARDQYNTLICDLDPQGSASFYFRVRASKKFKSKHLVKKPEKVDDNIRATDYENLDSLPSAISYRKLDIILDQLKNPKKAMNQVFKPFRDEYDFIFIDCPPNMTLVSENIFLAADILLVPTIPTTLSMLTFDTLIKFFKKKKLNPKKILPFFSMVENRKNMHKTIMKEYTRAEDNQFLKTVIPYSAIIEKMGIHREPVACYSGSSKAAGAYEALWQEVRTIAIKD